MFVAKESGFWNNRKFCRPVKGFFNQISVQGSPRRVEKQLALTKPMETHRKIGDYPVVVLKDLNGRLFNLLLRNLGKYLRLRIVICIIA